MFSAMIRFGQRRARSKYSLSGNLADLRTLLYKKNNGAFYLVTWLEKRGQGRSFPDAKQEHHQPAASSHDQI